MSQENVELAHKTYDAFNDRDLDAFLGLMDADVEAFPRVVALEAAYHGHDGFRRWWREFDDFLSDVALEVIAVRELGDVALTTFRMRGHGAGSDTPLDEKLWSATEWRAGKCVWWGNYGTEAEALEAVGLRE
jgi:ketosteroid isomerase-like protein